MISRCKFCKNRFFENPFLPLPHTCHFETRPSPLSKLGGNSFGAHFMQLYHKNEHGDPIFYFMILIRRLLPFNEKTIDINLCSVLAILLNRPFYRYGGHIELHRFKEYCTMPRGHEHISFVFPSAFRTFFLKVFLE